LLEGEEFGTDDPVDFWRIHKSGLLYQRSALRPNPFVVNERKQCAVDLGGTAFQVARAIDCLVHFYDELLGKNDHVVFAFSLLGVEGWPLIQLEGPRPISLIGISDKSEITVSRSSSLKDWREGLVEQALDISAEVFLNFGCTSADLEMARAMILRYSDQSVA
jgi:hypothetical protein